jgi:hypothetical protein
MPALAFLAVVGLALVALLFVADATLENGPPAIVTSDRTGLPKPWHPDTVKPLTTEPARAPDMTSPAILAAQPPEAQAKIGPAARAARAEAAPKKKRGTQQPFDYQQNYFVDRFSAKGQ